MRLATVSGRFVVVSDGQYVDVETATGGRVPADPLLGLARIDELRSLADRENLAGWSPVTVLDAPVPRPRQVFAIALNYRPHAAEAGFQAPEAPLVFTKFPSCIVGPDVDVTLPEGKVDWEIEVVAVIGRGGRDIARDNAWDAVAALTVGQDLSERVLQSTGAPPQFSLGKSHAGFGPIGPVAVTPDEFPDRDNIAFRCTLDGELVQSGCTSDMIFSVPELVMRLSTVCELLPGDLIFTGTPAGVGNRRNPPRYIQRGETLVSQVEHIGEIRQRFI